MIRRSLLLALLSLSIGGAAFSQPLSEQELRRLDPRLRGVVPEGWLTGAPARPPGLHAVYTGTDGENRYGVIIYNDNPAALRRAGIDVNSEHRSFVTSLVTAEDLVRLSRMPHVRYVEAGHERFPDNDVAAALVGATLLHDGVLSGTPYEGTGVIVCVFDTGIDFTHKDFRDPVDDTNSRILYLWDQTLTPTGGESTPAEGCCGYGVEYTKADIEDEIDGSPAGFVRQVDSDGHGTHVTGTAAGNGSSLSPARYVGMAPKADIVFIKGGDNFFSVAGIIDGFAYCDAKATAAGKPAVINLSLGSDEGPHDGTDAESIAADAFATGPGRMAVYSAGNSGDDVIHISGTVADAATATISLTVPSYSPGSSDDFELDLWFDTAGSVEVTVTSPNGHAVVFAAGTSSTVSTPDGDVFGDNDVDAGNGDRTVWVNVSDDSGPNPATGSWTIEIENTSGGSMDYHGWLFDERIGIPAEDVVPVGGDTDYTLSSTSTNTLIVGSYVHRWRWCADSGTCFSSGAPDRSDDPSAFSSFGPTRDGRQKPDITAPGQGMISAMSVDMDPPTLSRIMEGGMHWLTQGTSMSSPVVAGSVALLFEADPTLTAAEVLSTVRGSADTDGYTGAVWNSRWGQGRLNIFRAVADALGAAGTAQREILSYDEWGSDGSRSVGEKAAVRFTPTISGEAVGMFFHSGGVFSPLNLSGPLAAEVWSDDGSGLPDAKVGSTVNHDHALVRPFSWNYVDLSGTGANVSAGADYHAVLYATQGGDDFSLHVDDDGGTFDDRSTANGGGGWEKQSFDWRMRAVVANGIISLPVELISFNAVADDHAILLQWETASEEENVGWGVELKSGGTFEEIAFVSGGGTTDGSRSYSHRIADMAPGNYVVRLRQVNVDGALTYSPETEVGVGFSGSYFVSSPYPNPFNPRTGFKVAVPRRQHVRVDVYDALGRRVRSLVDDQLAASVTTAVEFDAFDLPSGLYLLRIAGEQFSVTKKVMLVK